MNKKYTYDYNIGQDVENEYINSLDDIMADYNVQMKEVTRIADEITDIKSQITRNSAITEDKIREWYNDDYVLNNSLKQSIPSKENEYYANLRYLSDVRFDTKIGLVRKENELRSLLEEKKLESQLLNMQMHNNSSEIVLEDMRKQSDSLTLEIKKLEHAISKIQELLNSIEPTQDEINLSMSGLNPRAKEIYEQIKNSKKAQADHEIDNGNSGGNGTGDDIGDDVVSENDPEPQLEPQPQDLSDYEKMLEIYKKHLNEYKTMFETLYKLQEKCDNGEISLEEYIRNEQIVLNEYENIKKHYDVVYYFYSSEMLKSNEEKQLEKPEEPLKPKKYHKIEELEEVEKKRKNKKLFWRTVAAIAVGGALGTTISLTTGTVGVGILSIVGITGKMALNAIRPKVKSIDELRKIDSIEQPSSKLKQAAKAVKNYFKSKEGLRDISVALGSSVIFGAATNLISSLVPNSELNNGVGTPSENTDNDLGSNSLDNSGPDDLVNADNLANIDNTGGQGGPLEQPDAGDYAIGDNIDATPEVGYDTAKWAIEETNAEKLIPEIINEQNTTINGFWANGQYYDAPGLTAEEVANFANVPVDEVVADLANSGTSVSWNTVEDLFEAAKGVSR